MSKSTGVGARACARSSSSDAKVVSTFIASSSACAAAIASAVAAAVVVACVEGRGRANAIGNCDGDACFCLLFFFRSAARYALLLSPIFDILQVACCSASSALALSLIFDILQVVCCSQWW